MVRRKGKVCGLVRRGELSMLRERRKGSGLEFGCWSGGVVKGTVGASCKKSGKGKTEKNQSWSQQTTIEKRITAIVPTFTLWLDLLRDLVYPGPVPDSPNDPRQRHTNKVSWNIHALVLGRMTLAYMRYTLGKYSRKN